MTILTVNVLFLINMDKTPLFLIFLINASYHKNTPDQSDPARLYNPVESFFV